MVWKLTVAYTLIEDEQQTFQLVIFCYITHSSNEDKTNIYIELTMCPGHLDGYPPFFLVALFFLTIVK